MSFKPLVTPHGPLSGSMAALCVPLVARNAKALLTQAQRVRALQPDVIEWRVDALEGLSDSSAAREDLLPLARELRTRLGSYPLILTMRAAREGGWGPRLSDTARVDLLLQLLSSVQPQFIDLELSTAEPERLRLKQACETSGLPLLLSSHDFSLTASVDTLTKIFDEMAEAGADVAKLAVMPNDFSDVLRLMSVTRAAADRLPIPVIGIAMGELGVVSRLFATECGSALTFVTDTESSAPGQLSLATYRQLQGLLSS